MARGVTAENTSPAIQKCVIGQKINVAATFDELVRGLAGLHSGDALAILGQPIRKIHFVGTYDGQEHLSHHV